VQTGALNPAVAVWLNTIVQYWVAEFNAACVAVAENPVFELDPISIVTPWEGEKPSGVEVGAYVFEFDGLVK
jgi:hypothetical protein